MTKLRMFQHRTLAQEDNLADVLKMFKNTAGRAQPNYSKQTIKAR